MLPWSASNVVVIVILTMLYRFYSKAIQTCSILFFFFYHRCLTFGFMLLVVQLRLENAPDARSEQDGCDTSSSKRWGAWRWEYGWSQCKKCHVSENFSNSGVEPQLLAFLSLWIFIASSMWMLRHQTVGFDERQNWAWQCQQDLTHVICRWNDGTWT